MGQVPGWVWPISLFFPIGVFIDFLLGKKGRESVIRVLEDWWVRFDDITRYNFGKQEGLFAVSILDYCFGKHILSFRRGIIRLTYHTA